ncbi:hypothetical protein INR49_000563 [Caranx melampygus]|nr:hypothetical protein INR49_000563 [Caranx melampygus]
MVYVSNGEVLDSRTQSPWRLSLLVDLLWGAVEFVGLFFRTLIYPDLTKDETVVHHASLMAEVLQVPLVAEGVWKSKPQHRAECSTNGRRRMRKVNAYTFCVGLGSAYPFADVSAEAPLHWLPLL